MHPRSSGSGPSSTPTMQSSASASASSSAKAPAKNLKPTSAASFFGKGQFNSVSSSLIFSRHAKLLLNPSVLNFASMQRRQNPKSPLRSKWRSPLRSKRRRVPKAAAPIRSCRSWWTRTKKLFGTTMRGRQRQRLVHGTNSRSSFSKVMIDGVLTTILAHGFVQGDEELEGQDQSEGEG